MLKSSSLCLYSSNLDTWWNLKKIFSSENTVPIPTKLCWNDPWVVPFQNCVRECLGRHSRTQFWNGTTQGSFQQSLVEIGSVVSEKRIFYYGIFYELWTFAYFDRLCKLEKRGDEIKKKSSPLKLLSQSQPNFAEMNLTHFWKRTIQWLFHQNLFLLSKWFQTRRCLWEFPIGSYVKLSSETIEPISTKLCWNESWLVLFQNCVPHFRTLTKMAATAELNLT
jgi:hypothetical protein